MQTVSGPTLALTLLLSLMLGLLLGRSSVRLPRRMRRSGGDAGHWRFAGLDPEQLLRWLEAAPTGWLLIDGGDVVRLLNPRASRLLDVGGAALLHALPLARVCDGAELAELVAAADRKSTRLNSSHRT